LVIILILCYYFLLLLLLAYLILVAEVEQLLCLCNLSCVGVPGKQTCQFPSHVRLSALFTLIVHFFVPGFDLVITGLALITDLLLDVLVLFTLFGYFLVLFESFDNVAFGCLQPLNVMDHLFLFGKLYKACIMVFLEFGFLGTDFGKLILHVGALLLDRVELRLQQCLLVVHLRFLFFQRVNLLTDRLQDHIVFRESLSRLVLQLTEDCDLLAKFFDLFEHGP